MGARLLWWPQELDVALMDKVLKHLDSLRKRWLGNKCVAGRRASVPGTRPDLTALPVRCSLPSAPSEQRERFQLRFITRLLRCPYFALRMKAVKDLRVFVDRVGGPRRSLARSRDPYYDSVGPANTWGRSQPRNTATSLTE